MSSQLFNSRSRAGFSLTEMVVVVAIMGVTASFATWETVRRKPRAELNRAAWEITTQLRRARLQAISRNRPCEVTFDTSDLTCTTWTDDDEDGAVDAGEATTVDLSDIEDLNMWVWPDTSCTFDTRGHITTGAVVYEDGSSYNLQYVYLLKPYAGAKAMYIYHNGQVDLRDQ